MSHSKRVQERKAGMAREAREWKGLEALGIKPQVIPAEIFERGAATLPDGQVLKFYRRDLGEFKRD